MGHVGRFAPAEPIAHPRYTRVICRTERGLELGQVLGHARTFDAPPDGTLLRRVTVEDDLLLARLEKNKDQAFQACQTLIRRRGLDAVLMDVEHLFDGSSLYFYFLGKVTPELESITSELAEAYEARVQFRQFTETLLAGCGTDCGTDAAAGGCEAGGCSVCAAAGLCKTNAR